MGSGETESPTHQRRDEQGEDRYRDEIFHDASCRELKVSLGIIKSAAERSLAD